MPDPEVNEDLLCDLSDYCETIKHEGWKAGEPLIESYGKKYANFRELAYALGVVLRAYELIDEKGLG